jgi:hypothetical protein
VMNLRHIILAAAMAIALTASFANVSPYLDFTVGYWHPSRVLLEGKNPYDFCDAACLADAMDSASLGRLDPAGMHVMYTPAVFPLFFPWAVLPLRAATAAYLFCFFFSIILALQLVAAFFTRTGRSGFDRNLAFWILAIPVGLLFQNVLWGSPSWMSLLGVVLFVVLFRRRPFMAGVFLSLTLVKIHLFVIFGAAVLACCLRFRNWVTPLAFATAAGVCIVTSMFFRPDILTAYAHVASTGQLFRYVNATVPSVGRSWLNVNGPLYLLGPTVLVGSVAFVSCWSADLSEVQTKLCAILPFSIGFAPYAWGHDYICAAPVLVIAAGYAVDQANKLTRRVVLAVLLIGLNLYALLLAFNGSTSPSLQLAHGIGVMAIGLVVFNLRVFEDRSLKI